MAEKTIVLRKDMHWYVINSQSGDEQEILLTLLEYSENQTYNIEQGDVMQLLDQLGWQIEIHDNLGVG